MTPYDEGWIAGYNDEIPECPYPEGTLQEVEWWEGYDDGSRNN